MRPLKCFRPFVSVHPPLAVPALPLENRKCTARGRRRGQARLSVRGNPCPLAREKFVDNNVCFGKRCFRHHYHHHHPTPTPIITVVVRPALIKIPDVDPGERENGGLETNKKKKKSWESCNYLHPGGTFTHTRILTPWYNKIDNNERLNPLGVGPLWVVPAAGPIDPSPAPGVPPSSPLAHNSRIIDTCVVLYTDLIYLDNNNDGRRETGRNGFASVS